MVWELILVLAGSLVPALRQRYWVRKGGCENTHSHEMDFPYILYVNAIQQRFPVAQLSFP